MAGPTYRIEPHGDAWRVISAGAKAQAEPEAPAEAEPAEAESAEEPATA